MSKVIIFNEPTTIWAKTENGQTTELNLCEGVPYLILKDFECVVNKPSTKVAYEEQWTGKILFRTIKKIRKNKKTHFMTIQYCGKPYTFNVVSQVYNLKNVFSSQTFDTDTESSMIASYMITGNPNLLNESEQS